MRRINQNNENTIEYWTDQYQNSKYEFGVDRIKFLNIANHIVDGSKVADFGAGNGEFLSTLYRIKSACIPTAVDYVNGIKDPEVEFIEQDFNKPFKIGLFDYIVSNETLEHLENPDIFVNSIYESLKQGGITIITTPYLDHIPSGSHVWEFDYEDLEKLMGRFTKTFVFPFSTGRHVNHPDGTLKYPAGHFDDIMAIGVK